MLSIIVLIAAFCSVAALVGGVAMMFRAGQDKMVEDRLDVLIGSGTAAMLNPGSGEASLLTQPLGSDVPGPLEVFVTRFGNLRKLLEQADVGIEPSKFLIISLALAGATSPLAFCFGLNILLALPLGPVVGSLPLAWCLLKRMRRFNSFAKQLPDALELIGRSLRAGHSLVSGFKLVADEMSEPISKEFTRIYEEQNLGIPLEESLEDLANRIPNLDLRFFVTAVILQRQTGGNLAEILDKIGNLVRERFKIWGQIQALTGEGRISGIVLMALPPVLFLVIYRLNPEYVQTLFDDPLGKRMLAVAIFLQIVGALVIRKIINIKV